MVSSPQAAALGGTFSRSLSHHHPGLHVLFSPATVQGASAPDSIVAAMQRVARTMARAEVLILARGPLGGATEESRLVLMMNGWSVPSRHCPVPVVTGPLVTKRDESTWADLARGRCLWAHTTPPPPPSQHARTTAIADPLSLAHRDRKDYLAHPGGADNLTVAPGSNAQRLTHDGPQRVPPGSVNLSQQQPP